ncbi:hypothetical protein HNY73_021709 [Argiope bruennichi]|uniref:Uncharacterized protein n=1 Tax=Argiope bruennichi TaxID=94029 RepID=A0A8T0E0Q8_ARGBR|nr:hypothetical protein HNY73_021709 [Argiope bruennichi]
MATTKISGHLLQKENLELPDIDKSEFEVEDQELINIFATKPLTLKKPFTQAFSTNPFSDDMVANPYGLFRKNTNPFDLLSKNDANQYTSIREDTRISKLDSSEWHESDKMFQKILRSKRHGNSSGTFL